MRHWHLAIVDAWHCQAAEMPDPETPLLRGVSQAVSSDGGHVLLRLQMTDGTTHEVIIPSGALPNLSALLNDQRELALKRQRETAASAPNSGACSDDLSQSSNQLPNNPEPAMSITPAVLSELHASLLSRTIDCARIQAFKHLFRGGLVLSDAPDDRRLRHTRSWQVFDTFDEDEAFSTVLPGEFIYAGPTYAHFGHVMAEMVHRILPSKHLFRCDEWLFVGGAGEQPAIAGFDALPDVFRQILQFLQVEPGRVNVIRENRIVDRIHVVEQGSDFGGGPKPGYLLDLREFSERRLDDLHGGETAYPKVYVSRTKVPHGGNFLGERYLEALLQAEGFTIFHPQNHPVSRQMDVYRKAELVIFPEGSACHGVELLGETMLNRCCLLVRREDHREIFKRVLAPRSREFSCYSGSTSLGAIVLHPASGEPLEHMGVSLLDTEVLTTFIRNTGIARLSTLDRETYFQVADADLSRYFEYHRNTRAFPLRADGVFVNMQNMLHQAWRA